MEIMNVMVRRGASDCGLVKAVEIYIALPIWRFIMSKCKSQCLTTTTLDDSGRRVMIAQSGSGKFEAGEKHPQCKECLQDMIPKEFVTTPQEKQLKDLKEFLKKQGSN